MIFKAILSSQASPGYGQATIRFPIPDSDYDLVIRMLEDIGVGSPTAQDCRVVGLEGLYPTLKRLNGQAINVDELDYLAKRLDSFSDGEDAQFEAMAFKLNLSSIKDFINLTFCCQQATVITNFSDLERVGKSHVLTINGGATAGITGLGDIGSIGQGIIEKLTTPEGLTASGVDFIFGGPAFNPVMMLFCVILMAYAVLKVFFANLKRGGILLIQIAVGALYMFSVPRGYTDGFTQWCKQIVGLCLTAFLQATILTAGLMVFSDHALLGLGLMLSAGEVPRIAGAFGLDTSTKASLTSAVHTAQMAVSTTKAVASAVGGK